MNRLILIKNIINNFKKNKIYNKLNTLQKLINKKQTFYIEDIALYTNQYYEFIFFISDIYFYFNKKNNI